MGRRPRAMVFLFAAAALAAAASCTRSAVPAPVENILLVTVDTLRADALGAYGRAAADTPSLDALAAAGVLFESATSTCSVTGPSHASIMTGLYPPRHGMLGNAWRLDRSVEKLPPRFAAAGFETAAFVSSAVLSSAAGLDHGFEVYDQAFLEGQSFARTLQRRGDATVDAALAWLEHRSPRRFFAWVHLFDPHAPYDPPEALWPAGRPRPPTDLDTLKAIHAGRLRVDEPTRHAMRALYHAEVRFADRQIGRLIDALARHGLAGRTLVALTADHGEELAEHGDFFEHSHSLYQGVLRVPLIVVDPALAARAGARVAAPVQILDLMPTLLERTGLAPPADLDAHSLVPLLRGSAQEPGRGFSLAQRPHNPRVFARGDAFALLRGPTKLIVYEEGPPELYDLAADPGETRDRYRPGDAEQAALRREALARMDGLRRRGDPSRQQRVELREQVERLRALGYAVDGPTQ